MSVKPLRLSRMLVGRDTERMLIHNSIILKQEITITLPYNMTNAGEFLTRVLDCKGMVYAGEADGKAQNPEGIGTILNQFRPR